MTTLALILVPPPRGLVTPLSALRALRCADYIPRRNTRCTNHQGLTNCLGRSTRKLVDTQTRKYDKGSANHSKRNQSLRRTNLRRR